MSPAQQKRYSEISLKHGDPWIWGIYIMLLIISVIESYSASSREIATAGIYMPLIKQCFFLGTGALFVIGLHKVNYKKPAFLYTMIPGLFIFTLITLVYVMFWGETINGARRAMTVIPGVLTVQPAELAKLSIVMLLSYVFAKTQKNRDISNNGIAIAAFFVMLYGGFMFHSGLTNTLLLMAISGSMLLIGGAKFKKIGYIFLFFIFLGGMYLIISSHNDGQDEVIKEGQKELAIKADEPPAAGDKADINRMKTRTKRIDDWVSNDSLLKLPVTPQNQQQIFSRMAQAHGRVFGTGIGQSRECSRLPLAFSDYIFSIIVEELGFVGGAGVLLLYLSLLARAALIVRRSKRVLPALLVIGMASFITYQALFHMAINVGVFPVSGQPLPLISKGGTSIIVVSVAFGVMLSVSRTIAIDNSNHKNEEDIPDIEGLDAWNPTEIPINHEWK